MADEDLLSIRSEVRGEIGYLYLKGQLLAESRFKLDRLLRDWIEARLSGVIISCRDLHYIDSAGLSTWIGALHRLRQIGWADAQG